MSVKIRLAGENDFSVLSENDNHVSSAMLKKKISDKNILIADEDDKFAGWLRYNFFWDEIPFMNMLFVTEKFRGKGIGAELVRQWERLMREQGCKTLLTSTRADENAQHFYRKLGYKDLGGFFPFCGEYEIIFGKRLQ